MSVGRGFLGPTSSSARRVCWPLASAVLFRHLLAHALNNPPLAEAMIFYAPYLLCVFIAAATPPALVASGAAGYAAVLNAAVGAFF